MLATPFLDIVQLAPGHLKYRIGLLEGLLAELDVAQGRDTPGNQARRAAILQEIGLSRILLIKDEVAIESFNEALAFIAVDHRRGEGNALGNLGIAYANLGQVERAIGYYEQQLEITREIGDRRGEGIAYANLGIAYAKLGQVERAIGSFEQALEISREIGDRWGEGDALGNLGIAYADLGQEERAIGHEEQALVIMREIGNRQGEGNAVGNLGNAYAILGQMDRAIGYYEQAVRDRAGDRRPSGRGPAPSATWASPLPAWAR